MKSIGRRGLGLALMSLALVVPASASANQKAAAADPFKVLVVTSTTDALTTAGIAAITSAGAGGIYTVTAPAPAAVGAEFTPANLDSYRAVVFLNTGMASPLTDPQRANFEAYFRKGGGFVGIGSAIETDPSWTFLTNVLGTRASGRTDVQSGTVKVADRVHDASKGLPEYWERTDNFYNFTTNVRGVSHVLATVVEDPFGPQPQGNTLDGIAGGTMGADHPISFCKDYQGGRSFYTGLGNTAGSYRREPDDAPQGRDQLGRGPERPGLQRLRRDRAQELPAGQGQRAAEPARADRLRSAPGRPHHPDRAYAARFACTTRSRARRRCSRTSRDAALPQTMRLYTNSEDGLYGPAVDNNFATNKWVYLYYSPQTVTDVKLSNGDIVTQTTPNTAVPNSAASPGGLGSVHRLLPALALQVRR